MRKKLLIFLLIFGTLTALLESYLYFAYVASGWMPARLRFPVTLFLLLCWGLQITVPWIIRSPKAQLRNRFITGVFWFTYGSMGFLGSLVLYTLVAQLMGVIAGGLIRETSLTFALASAWITGVIGFIQAIWPPKINRLDIQLKALAPEFDGFKIAVISDLHVGPTVGKTFANRVAQLTHQETPDAIALVGDLVDGPCSLLQDAISPITELQAPHGVYFVTGNHEYFSGEKAWIDHFKASGIRVLENAHIALKRGNSNLVLGGVYDLSASRFDSTHECNPERAIVGAPVGAKILFAHHPGTSELAEKAGWNLQISGHTHGGQFFPFSVLNPLFHRHVKGLYSCSETFQVFVGVGAAYWGPPIRTFVRPEIPILTLRRAV